MGTHKSEASEDYYGVWNGVNQVEYHVKIKSQFKADSLGTYKKYIVPSSQKEQHRKNIFRYAYGGVLGNRDPADDPDTYEGWDYRGKGAIQLTGKSNYKRNQEEILKWFNMSFDLVSNPDIVATNNTVVVYSAIAYILQNVSKIENIDTMTIDQFSALVNTGNASSPISNVNGAADRAQRYNQLIATENLFKCDEE